MNIWENNRKVIANEVCNDCNKKNLIIYECGSYHCWACSAGWMLLAFDPMEDKFKYVNLLNKKEIVDKITNPHIHWWIFVLWHLKKWRFLQEAFNELDKISPKEVECKINNSDQNPNKYWVTLWNLFWKWYSSKDTLEESILDVINKFKNNN